VGAKTVKISFPAGSTLLDFRLHLRVSLLNRSTAFLLQQWDAISCPTGLRTCFLKDKEI
jgi:hypothetical protein